MARSDCTFISRKSPTPQRILPTSNEHKAEEAFYLLEGSADYTFGGKTVTAGPGEVVFIPSGVYHAENTYHTPTMKYLTIRTLEPEDEPCCCGEDRESQGPSLICPIQRVPVRLARLRRDIA